MVFTDETEGWISQKEEDFLIKKEPRIPYFYVLLKIHKGQNPPPGLPIVSGIDSLLEPLSRFCDHFLQPVVQKTHSFLQDTRDVLNLMKILTQQLKLIYW